MTVISVKNFPQTNEIIRSHKKEKKKKFMYDILRGCTPEELLCFTYKRRFSAHTENHLKFKFIKALHFDWPRVTWIN